MSFSTTKHLLVLDDDPDILALIASAAQLSGFSVYTTTEPDDFFNNIDQCNPDIAIIDLVMPKQDGVEILQRLANDTSHRPLLVITSGAGERVLDAAKRIANELGLEVAGLLSKPFRISSIRALLAKETYPSRGSSSFAVNPSEHHNPPHTFSPDELVSAISKKQLVAYYQPKVCSRTGDLKGFEALARWQHPEYGLVLPDSFVGAMENAQCIWEMTTEITRQALTFINNLNRDDLHISVNLSAKLLDRSDLVEFMTATCAEYDIPTDRVIFEITESSTNDNTSIALSMLTRLRVKGFRLSIDDFGVGYSSLVHLSRFPFSEIKVDKSFVHRLEHSDEAAKIIKTIVALGQGLSLEVVAEGIETADQLKILSAYGCDTIQGFYVSRPLPPEEMRLWIDNYQPLKISL